MDKLLSAIGHFVKHAAVFVSEEFVKVLGSDAAHNLAAAAEGVLKTELGKIVWTAVNEAGAVASGAEAKNVAFIKIEAAAATAGIQAKDSIVNMLIELAVQKAKGNFGPDPSATAA